MITVKFTSVGHGKRDWTQTIPELSQDAIEKAARKGGSLMSRSIEASLDEAVNESGNQTGIIFAGFHTVGRFEVMKEVSA